MRRLQHPVRRCLNEACEVDFPMFDGILSRYAWLLFFAAASTTTFAIMAVGVVIAYDMGISQPERDTGIVAGLVLSIGASRYLIWRISGSPTQLRQGIGEISNETVIEGETV